MLRRVCRCFRNIRKVFRRNNKVHPLISDDTELMNYNVPTPMHLFQTKIETEVVIEETVKEENVEIEDYESSYSDPIQMTPSPGVILIVVQEAEIQMEYTTEIPRIVPVPADCTELLKRYKSRQIERKDLMDDSESSTSLVTEYLEESDVATSSDDTSDMRFESLSDETEYFSASDDILDEISEDLPEDLYTSPGSVNILKIDYSSEESSYSTSDSLDIAKYPTESSGNTSDSLSEDLSEDLNESEYSSEALSERSETRGACAYQGRRGSVRQTALISTDDFQFCRWLGSGCFGQVYQAQHKKTGKMLAIKRMDKDSCYDSGIVERVFLERDILRLARSSRNPFLVSLFCSFQSEHHVYIAMEFAAGGSLASRLKNGALPAESTLFYSACIVLGIKFLHENRIVHRDLKPDNVVIDSAGYAKLADFGLCRAGIEYRSVMSYPCGDWSYSAPEILRDEPYDRTVDWWALGVIIYEMAVGKLPFTGEMEELCEKALNTEQEYPTHLDNRTAAIIGALLQKDPGFRLGSERNDGEQVQKFCYFEPIDWKALKDRQLQAPFIPSQDVDPAEEGEEEDDEEDEESDDGVETPPHYWPLNSKVHKAFTKFDEMPEDL